MDKKMNIRLVELFMAKAGWDRCFYGTLNRTIDENGSEMVHGKIKVNDGIIYSQASTEKELGEKLDELVLYVLEYKKPTMYKHANFFGIKYFAN
jgi:hypothetical protein